jgi:ligand-binding sensor domain-containing protein/signal transduction histidine kinase
VEVRGFCAKEDGLKLLPNKLVALPHSSSAEAPDQQAAEKGLNSSEITEYNSAGAKAQRLLSAICGTNKVMPCYKTGPSQSFSAACLSPEEWFSSDSLKKQNIHKAPKSELRIQFRALLAAVLVLGGALSAAALEPTTPLANYGRQTWGMENGLPQNTVQALAQTRDGYIWLGTEVGLVRFDGNSFAVFDKNSMPNLPGSDVRCLLETRDGALWIGTSEGLARWKDGAVTAFTTKDGLPGNSVKSLFLNFDASIEVETLDGDAEYKDGRLSAVESVCYNCPSVKDLVHLPNGGDAARTATIVSIGHNHNNEKQLAIGRDLPGNKIQKLFADREGNLWIGTNGGLARWIDGKVQRFPVTDALATASVLAIMEDREGNLWVGTETDGLHILRDQRFRSIGAREGLSSDATTAVVEDRAGTLWVGTNGNGLNALRSQDNSFLETHPSHKDKDVARVGHPDGLGSRFPRSENLDLGYPVNRVIKSYTVSNGLLSDVILALAAAPNGDLWVGTPDGLNRIHAGKVDAFTSADGLPDDFIRSLLADGDGSLWIGTRRGLTHWTGLKNGSLSNAHMETFTHANGLGSDLVGAMTRDAHGDLWVATLAGLSRLSGGRIVNYTTANGLSSNVITALLARANGTLLIGTQEHGWNLWDGQRFTAQSSGGLNKTSIHAILEDGGDHLWFATGDGIARCDSDGKAGCSHWIEFGAADGLRSRETTTNSHPSAWRSRNGELWFATPKGLVEIDPAHFPVNTVSPPVVLERFAVDDVSQALRAANTVLRIEAGHVHFQFDFAGLSFIAPQKVRYRYMLEGLDRGWIEAGARRSAYYTNIRPGRYTFRVQAANNDGLWNTEGAALTFELRPHFYQTLWFFALLLAAAVCIIVLLLRLRLRRAEGEFRAVLGERNRIAREIHDTLAQGYVGISVQLEVLSELLRHNKAEAAAKHLDLTRGYVREGLAEARQSIWALRSQDSGETTLPVRLRRIVEVEGGHGLKASFSLFGAYRPMPSETEREFLRVAQEAIHNVKKHAAAQHLFVQLEYGPEQIALEVRDDGCGFTASEQTESAQGHYGLTGMRERAAAIGGTLDVTSELGTGSTVRLRAAVSKDAGESAKEPQ